MNIEHEINELSIWETWRPKENSVSLGFDLVLQWHKEYLQIQKPQCSFAEYLYRKVREVTSQREITLAVKVSFANINLRRKDEINSEIIFVKANNILSRFENSKVDVSLDDLLNISEAQIREYIKLIISNKKLISDESVKKLSDVILDCKYSPNQPNLQIIFTEDMPQDTSFIHSGFKKG